MKIYTTASFRHEYFEVELCHPDYGNQHEYWFIEYDYDEEDDYYEILGEHVRKNVSSFWHDVILKTKYVIDGKLHVYKYTYSVPTGECVNAEIETYEFK